MRVTIEKKTDQLNYEDFLRGVTRTVTIAGVTKGTKEQQYDIAIEGDKRVWRPAVTVLKLLVAAWGDEAKEWVGRRVTLYGDPDVMFGDKKVGGIRVSHMSDLPDGEPLTANLSVTRGRRELFTVQPIADVAEPSPAELAHIIAAALQDATTEAEVREWGNRAHARNLLDTTPDGSPVTLREMVTARLADIAPGGDDK